MSASTPTLTPASSSEDGPGARRHTRGANGWIGWALVLFAAIALEAFPVAAWLSLLAASAGASPQAAALPLWWLFGVMLLAALVMALFGSPVDIQSDQDVRDARLVLAFFVVVGWALTALLSLVFSPDAYAGQNPLQAVASFFGDLFSGGGRFGADFGLLALTAYLWWRGLSLTREPIARERMYVRFLAGLGAIMLAITGVAAIAGAARTLLTALLLLLLLGDVFVGLVGLALAYIADAARERRERRKRRPPAAGEEDAAPVLNRTWITAVLAFSALLVLLALGLGALLSYDTLRALAGLLQPVLAAIGQLLLWLIEGIAFVLFLLLNPLVTWLQSHTTHHQISSVPQRPTASGNKLPPPAHLPPEWLIAGRLVLVALVIVVLAIVLLRLLRRIAVLRAEQGFDEQREALDASALLGQQLRDFFARRAAAPSRLVEESLAPGSVRYLYRELLRTTARLGHSRRPSETPDEYARRLPAELPTSPIAPGAAPGQAEQVETERALAELTGAYDAARYSGPPAETQAPSTVTGAWQAIQRRLTGAESGRERRRGLFRRG